MIFVTLGNQDNKFDRLLKAIEREIKNKNIKDKVIVQAGYTEYKSDLMEIHDYFPMDEFERIMSECDLLITHGGVASINDGLKRGKKVIATPRLARYKEHANDHQKQIIKKYSEQGYIIELNSLAKLDEALKKAKTFKVKKYKSNTKEFVSLIDDYIEKTNHKSWLNKSLNIIIALIIAIILYNIF